MALRNARRFIALADPTIGDIGLRKLLRSGIRLDILLTGDRPLRSEDPNNGDRLTLPPTFP